MMGWVDIFSPPKLFGPPNPRALAGRDGLVRRAISGSFFFLGTTVSFKKIFDFYYRLCYCYTLLICELYTIDFML